MKKIFGLCVVLSMNAMLSMAQDDNNENSTEEEEVSNVQNYTPSKLLKKGQVDVQLFNNLYTQTSFRNGERELLPTNSRDTYFRSFVQALFGTSKSGRVNWGMDVVFSSVRIDSDPKSAGLKVLAFESSNQTRTAFSAIGPKIKFSPIKSNPDFSVQSALWFPIAKDSESDISPKPWLDWNRLTSWTQFFYSQTLSTKWQMFYEIDLLARFTLPAAYYESGVAKENVFTTPASVFVNYFSSSKSTVYAMAQYTPGFGTATGVQLSNDFAQLGLGGKYQITPYFQLELLYSHFVYGKNSGAGRTYNVGLRYIR